MISSGHSAADVWAMTPRQVDGYIQLATARKREEMADLLSLYALGSRGDGKALEKKHKELLRGF